MSVRVARRRCDEAASAIGLRRVDQVRITITDVGVHCEVDGVGHRLPTTTPVPVGVAVRLVAAGAQHQLRDHRSETHPGPAGHEPSG